MATEAGRSAMQSTLAECVAARVTMPMIVTCVRKGVRPGPSEGGVKSKDMAPGGWGLVQVAAADWELLT